MELNLAITPRDISTYEGFSHVCYDVHAPIADVLGLREGVFAYKSVRVSIYNDDARIVEVALVHMGLSADALARHRGDFAELLGENLLEVVLENYEMYDQKRKEFPSASLEDLKRVASMLSPENA